MAPHPIDPSVAAPPPPPGWGAPPPQTWGAAPPQTWGPPPVAFRPVQQLGFAVQALLGITILTLVAGVATSLRRAGMVDRLIAGEGFTPAEIDAVDAAVVVSTALYLVALVVTAIVWVVWFRRSYDNLTSLSGRPLVHSRRWAAGAWFVPVLNLFRPKQIADDLFRAGAAPSDSPVPRIVHVWWGLFVLASLGDRVLLRAPGDDAASIASADRISAAVDAVMLAAGVAAILVVRALNARQQARVDDLAAGRLVRPVAEWSGAGNAGAGAGGTRTSPPPPPIPF